MVFGFSKSGICKDDSNGNEDYGHRAPVIVIH